MDGSKDLNDADAEGESFEIDHLLDIQDGFIGFSPPKSLLFDEDCHGFSPPLNMPLELEKFGVCNKENSNDTTATIVRLQSEISENINDSNPTKEKEQKTRRSSKKVSLADPPVFDSTENIPSASNQEAAINRENLPSPQELAEQAKSPSSRSKPAGLFHSDSRLPRIRRSSSSKSKKKGRQSSVFRSKSSDSPPAVVQSHVANEIVNETENCPEPSPMEVEVENKGDDFSKLDVPSTAISSPKNGNEEDSQLLDATVAPALTSREDDPQMPGIGPEPECVRSIEPDKTAYFAPFANGWKREVNLIQGGAIIVYIHPLGLRLKDVEDVCQHLTDGLSLANFTFSPEPLGADPDVEIIVPELKLDETPMETDEIKKEIKSPPPLSVRKSGRIPVPSSNYKLAAMGKMEESGRRKISDVLKTPAKEKLIFKVKTKTSKWGTETPRLPEADKTEAVVKRKAKKRSKKPTENFRSGRELQNPSCPRLCPLAKQSPSLPCSLCLCLYHPECFGISKANSDNFICKSCRGQSDVTSSTQPVNSIDQQGPPYPFPFPSPPAIPQFFVVLPDNRRFIVVPNLSAASTTCAPAPPQAVALAAGAPDSNAKNKKLKKKRKILASGDDPRCLGDICASYLPLMLVLKHLSLRERLEVAKTCRFLRHLVMEPSLWRVVNITTRVTDWAACASSLLRGGTKILNLTEMPGQYSAEEWLNTADVLAKVPNLDTIHMPIIPPSCCLQIMRHRGLRKFRCEISDFGGPLTLTASRHSSSLEEIYIKFHEFSEFISFDLSPIKNSLQTLSLLHVQWNNIDIAPLKELTNLTELQLGECWFISVKFPSVLLSLLNLKRIRLESCDKQCPTVEILKSLASLPNLEVLELINFDGSAELESALAKLKKLRALLLIPKFDNQSATKSNATLKALYKLKNSLLDLALVFTLEFLQVTELKNQKSSESCVPILQPLPTSSDGGSASRKTWSDLMARYKSVPGPFAAVPLTDLQQMLSLGLPHTRALVTKVPFSETTQQTLKLLLP